MVTDKYVSDVGVNGVPTAVKDVAAAVAAITVDDSTAAVAVVVVGVVGEVVVALAWK